ncbi:MAG: hypothetical protein PHT79_02295 [Syntrophomonadaceae bacterium]|nr:hypothetical protein [Syntrophomonadaceae bacterium]MDD3890620.1 hypothetical protein [Syntrophomonadaceae bacterium]MDD4548569.1 hypothetical protein [Syntrophomonadaceae bacterium]
MGGYKKDKDSVAHAKGKNNTKFSNELFAAVDDFFYEFGIIGKQKNNNENSKTEDS